MKWTALANGVAQTYEIEAATAADAEAEARRRFAADAEVTVTEEEEPTRPVYPDAGWRVFADDAVWNDGGFPRIVDPNSKTMIDNLAKQGLTEETSDKGRRNWGTPLWFGDANSPLYTLNTTHGDPDSKAQDGRKLRCPPMAKPSAMSDGVAWIIDTEGGWINQVQRAQFDHIGKVVNCWKSYRMALDGNGFGETLTHSPTGIQPIRPEELRAGYVNHAMSFGTDTLTSGPVAPYEKSTTLGKPLPPNTVQGHLHMGSVFFLDMTHSEIESLNMPVWREAVFKGAADHGIVVGLNGGSNFSLKFQNPLDGCSYAGLPTSMTFDFGSVKDRLKVVKPFPEMPDYPLYPDGYWAHFRSLRMTSPHQQGWDVYALQTGLGIEADGDFGAKTGAAVFDLQREHRLEVDGIAGQITQRALAMPFVRSWERSYSLPRRLMLGQIEHESSFLVGNQSPTRDDGNADCGICQRNSEHTEPKVGFHVPNSIRALASQIAVKHKLYKDIGKVSPQRAWELASGSWNAPAWTDILARGEKLTADQSAHIEAYMNETTAYVRWP